MRKFEIIFAIIELCIGIYFSYKGSDMNIFFLLMSGYHWGKGLWGENK